MLMVMQDNLPGTFVEKLPMFMQDLIASDFCILKTLLASDLGGDLAR
jgi:hypothetical protein